METSKQLAVIIPVHKVGDEAEQNLLRAAIESVANQAIGYPALLLIPVAAEAKKAVKSIEFTLSNLGHTFETAHVVINTGNTNFQSQVNFAVSQLPEEITHFTVLEFDDVLRRTYTEHVETYVNAFPEAAVLLPLVEEVNLKGELLKYSNEVLWTPNFSENLGELDYEALQGFANFHLPGAVINKADFLEAGGLKPSMELTFNYEFLLRLAQKDKQIRSIPKAVYIKLDARPGSLFQTYTKGRTALTDEEVRFWFDTAHKECFFPEDRKVAYSPVKGE